MWSAAGRGSRGREQVLLCQGAEGRAGGKSRTWKSRIWAPWQLRGQRKQRKQGLKEPRYCSCSALVSCWSRSSPMSLLLRQGAHPSLLPWVLWPCPWQRVAAVYRIFIWAWGHRALWAWYRPVQTGTITFVTPEAFED